MKIIFLTDIHGSFNQTASLLYESVADLYIIGGDLIDIPFYSINTAIQYHDIQTYLHSLRKKMSREVLILEDFVNELLDSPNVPEDIIDKGSEYQQLTIRARRVMQQKYKVLENMISFKSSTVFALPGNYDMDLKFTSLHERDLHMHWHNIGGLKVAGYGGADVWTAGIPERYIVKYNGGIGTNDRNNEMWNFFKAIKPDIIVAHQPAHGIHDRIARIGPSGSPALRTFCENNAVKLCLTGHIHNDWGFKEVEGCVYLNPSNFGEVTTVQGEVSEGGFFYQIEFNETDLEKISLKKFVGDHRIHDIAEYYHIDGRWLEDIIDVERFQARRLGQNYDMHIQKYHHIPEIELFKEIKNFFRMFRTQETEDRLDELDHAIEMLKDKFDDIAMDIVGSVNMGISQESSDIDIVLYLRCGRNCQDMYEQCDYYKSARALLDNIIGDKYKFQIIDCIDLNVVERSIIMKNYECEVTQRFVAYRSICRPVNYKAIAPIEDILNEDIEFRREMEGSIRSYFRIFATTSQHMRSFDKYESRLKSIGIKLPESIRDKIREYLQVTNTDNLNW